MTKVGVIGLGDMGSGLAKNLIKAGFDVAGLDSFTFMSGVWLELLYSSYVSIWTAADKFNEV